MKMVHSRACYWKNQGSVHHIHEQVASCPIASILDLPDPPDTWVVSYELLWLTNGKRLGSRMAVPTWTGSILFGRLCSVTNWWGKSSWRRWEQISSVGWTVSFPCRAGGIEQQSESRGWENSDSWTVANSFAIWSGRKSMESGLLRGYPYGKRPCGNHNGNLRGAVNRTPQCPSEEPLFQTGRWVAPVRAYLGALTWGVWVGPWNEWIWGSCSNTDMGWSFQNCSICWQKRRDSRWLWGRLPGRRPPYWHVDYTGLLPVALGGYKWVLTEIDTSLDRAFIPSDNANAQNTKKGLQKKMLYLFGLLSCISSE